ncbi:MAG: transcription termination/antitermination protein NusA, partial [Gaiellaceae bacterium]|nr:transcription termination/antitermination protein NusA [Gaiellaceae bacterium]
TVVVPDDQLALAIGKEGLNARLAARLTGWKIDIQSESEFARAEADAAYGGGDDADFTGRCAAILSNGKRCPNGAVPGSRFCGVPGHQELAKREAGGEILPEGAAIPIAGPPSEEDEEGGDEIAGASDETTEQLNESDIAIEESIDVAPIAEADEPGRADEVAAELIAAPVVETSAGQPAAGPEETEPS